SSRFRHLHVSIRGKESTQITALELAVALHHRHPDTPGLVRHARRPSEGRAELMMRRGAVQTSAWHAWRQVWWAAVDMGTDLLLEPGSRADSVLPSEREADWSGLYPLMTVVSEPAVARVPTEKLPLDLTCGKGGTRWFDFVLR